MNKKICELKKENKLNEKNNIFIYLFRKLKIKNKKLSHFSLLERKAAPNRFPLVYGSQATIKSGDRK